MKECMRVAAATAVWAGMGLFVACSGGVASGPGDAPLDGATGRDTSTAERRDNADGPLLFFPDVFTEPPADAFVNPFGGASGCDGGIDAGATVSPAIAMPVQGGLSTVLGETGTFGGGANGATLVWATRAPDSSEVDIIVRLYDDIPYGVVGPAPAILFALTWIQPDGSSVQWTAPAGACMLTFDSNVCNADSSLRSRGLTEYALSGTGHCAEPLAPVPGNPGSPVVVGDFWFVSSIVASVGATDP
jgi:hypothetical protein